MMERRLFDDAEGADPTCDEPKASVLLKGTPRLRVACRDQIVMRMLALDQMLPADDEARTVVAFVEQCDLSELSDSILAVEGQAGRAPADPQILLSLWLYATLITNTPLRSEQHDEQHYTHQYRLNSKHQSLDEPQWQRTK